MWIDRGLGGFIGHKKSRHRSEAWLQLMSESLGAVAAAMFSVGLPATRLPHGKVVHAIENEIRPGRQNYRTVTDEVLDQFFFAGLLIPAQAGIAFCHETVRDFFFA